MAQLVVDYWTEIGIRAVVQEEARNLFSERCSEGHTVDMGIWMADRCLTPLIEPWSFFPYQGGTPPSTAAQWWQWYQSGGEQGEAPPEEVAAQYALYDEIKGAPPSELPDLANSSSTTRQRTSGPSAP